MLKQTNAQQRFWLPSPPSTNNLFIDAPGRPGRPCSDEYQAWRRQAMQELQLQKPKRLDGRVTLAFFFGLRSPVADCSNFIKAPEDLLVEAGVIEGDNAKVVQSVSACWVPNYLGMVVHVTPYVESETMWLGFDEGVLGAGAASKPADLGMHPRAIGRLKKLGRPKNPVSTWSVKNDPAKPTARQRAKNILMRNPGLSTAEVAELACTTVFTVRNALKDLIKEGKIKVNSEA